MSNSKSKQILSIFIMPISLLAAMVIMYIVTEKTNINYYNLTYDYKYFYVFSAPVILLFSGAFAVPRLWKKENKRRSIALMSISFLLNVVITVGVTFFEDLWYSSLYLINPFDSMSVNILDIFNSEYAIFFPIVFLWFLILILVNLVLFPIAGAFLFHLKNKKIKLSALLLVMTILVSIGSIGIYSYSKYSVYYDVKGNIYNNPYDVIYYDEDGRTYQIIEIPDYDFDFNANNVKVKSEDKEYYLGECYVNEKTGLLITDENCEIILPLTEEELAEKERKEFDSDSYIHIYKDREGSKYRRLADARYNKNGRLNKKFKFLVSDDFTSLRKDANADGDFYFYDQKGNRYVLGEDIKYYDAQGNTYKRQARLSYAEYNTNYDVFDKNGNKIGTVDGNSCLIDAKTGYLVPDAIDNENTDIEYDFEKYDFFDKEGNKYYLLSESVYDKNGNVTKDSYQKFVW